MRVVVLDGRGYFIGWLSDRFNDWLSDRSRNWCGGDCRNWRSEEFSDAVRKLRAIADPVVDAVALEFERGGRGARVVCSNDFDGAAIACAILLDDNYSIVGLLAGANARQTDHQHLGNPLKDNDVFGRRDEIERSSVEGRNNSRNRRDPSSHNPTTKYGGDCVILQCWVEVTREYGLKAAPPQRGGGRTMGT